MVVSRDYAWRRSRRAPSRLHALLALCALLAAPTTVLAEQPPNEGDLPPPPPRPADAVDSSTVGPAPSATPTEPSAAPPPAPPAPAPAAALRAAPPASAAHPAAPPDEETDELAPPDPIKRKGPPRRWYGWQTLAVDGAAFGMTIASAVWAANSELGSDDKGPVDLLGVAFLTYELGAPIVHFVHGNTGKGFGSIGLRLVGPPVVGLFGAVVCAAACSSGGGDFGDLRPLIGFVLGYFVGLVAVPIIDATVLAYDPTVTERVKQHAKLTLFPNLVVRRDHTVLVGVQGGF